MAGSGTLNVEMLEMSVSPNVKTAFVGAADVLAGWLHKLESVCTPAAGDGLEFGGIPGPAPT